MESEADNVGHLCLRNEVWGGEAAPRSACGAGVS